jgi:hypothetical protein
MQTEPFALALFLPRWYGGSLQAAAGWHCWRCNHTGAVGLLGKRWLLLLAGPLCTR